MWFGLLGPLQVRHEDQALAISAVRLRILLAAMLLRPGKPLSSTQLAELVWDGQTSPGSVVTLRSYVMRLRRSLGPAIGARIVTAGDGYLINAAADEVDVTRFESLCAAGGAAVRVRAWSRACDLLTQAESLWRGDPLADVPCQALKLTEVPRLEELRLQAAQWRIEADLALTNHDKVIPELRALVAEHPLREPFHLQLMQALASCGRQADALAAYRDARAILISELGIEPGPDLQNMQQRILDGERARPGTAPRPMRIPRQLPPPVPHFVGRSAELGALTALLTDRTASGTTKIAAIVGTAGVGKTALAVHWAHQLAEHFPDGQLFLNLNGHGPAGTQVTPADAASRLLETMQVSLARMPSSLDGRIGLYRTLVSERRILIVLDNARDADHVRPLLPSGPGCLVLATSRSPMTGLIALDGASAINLKVFTDAEARQMVVRRLGTKQTAANSAAIDQLIGACARLPLALAVATALIATRPGQSLAGAAADLSGAEDRLNALQTGEAASDLRSVFRWSYEALTGPAARMFRLLAEHPGPDISAAAAASLAGVPAPRSRQALAELTNSQLVDEPAAGRFAFHDLLRLYAAEQLQAIESPADRRAAGQRVLDHYLHTARGAAIAISPTRKPLDVGPAAPDVTPEPIAGEDDATAWLQSEHRVMMRAIGYAAGAGFDAYGWQLSWTLTDFLYRSGHWLDWADSQRTALAAATRLGDVAAQAQAHRYIGRACFQLGEFDDALDHLGRSLELHRQLGDASGEAGVSGDLARLHEQRGEVRDALGSAEAALDLYRALGHRAGEAMALNNIGWYQALEGNLTVGLSYCTEAVQLCAELGYKMAEGHTWDSLGYIHQRIGQPEQALACYRTAVDILHQLGDLHDESRALTHLGDALQETGDLTAARRAWQDALVILDDLDHPECDQLRAKIGQASLGSA